MEIRTERLSLSGRKNGSLDLTPLLAPRGYILKIDACTDTFHRLPVSPRDECAVHYATIPRGFAVVMAINDGIFVKLHKKVL